MSSERSSADIDRQPGTSPGRQSHVTLTPSATRSSSLMRVGGVVGRLLRPSCVSVSAFCSISGMMMFMISGDSGTTGNGMPYGSIDVVTSRNLISSSRCFIHSVSKPREVGRVGIGPVVLERPLRRWSERPSAPWRRIRFTVATMRLVGQDVGVRTTEHDRATDRSFRNQTVGHVVDDDLIGRLLVRAGRLRQACSAWPRTRWGG